MKKPLNDEQKSMMEEIGKRIVAKMKSVEEVVEIDGTPTLTVKRLEGDYRKVSMFHGWEFFFHDSYVGSRGFLIFVMEPVEEKTFKYLEVGLHEIDNAMPLMAPKIAEAFGFKNVEKLGDVLQLVENLILEEEDEEKKEAEMAASNNPLWGKF